MDLLRPVLLVLSGAVAAIVCMFLGVDRYLPPWLRLSHGRPVMLSINGPDAPGRCGVRYTVDNDTDHPLFVSWNVPPPSDGGGRWPSQPWDWNNGGWQSSYDRYPDEAPPRPTEPDYYNPNPAPARSYDETEFDEEAYDPGRYDGNGGSSYPPSSDYGGEAGNYVPTTPGYPPPSSAYPPPTDSTPLPPPVPATAATTAVEVRPRDVFSTPDSGGYDERCDRGAHTATIEVHE